MDIPFKFDRKLSAGECRRGRAIVKAPNFSPLAKVRCGLTGRARLGRLAVAHRIKEEFQWCQLSRFNECERGAVLKVPVW